ncbi:MAG: FAD-binding and (Fe-S)-binding domain-containing protein [Bacillota bacterium]
MLSGLYKQLFDDLKKYIPENRLIHDELRTLAYGTDASFYRLIPKLVVKVESEQEVITVLKFCRDLNLPVTFRAAGTSLSGQAISDSVLVLLGSKWNKYSINNDASEIKLQPGVIGSHANFYLAPFNKKIGPDPASINSAMIGGIAANNASGMCCGTAQNSYKTLSGLRIIFSDGTTLDTTDKASVENFRTTHKDMLDRICSLAAEVKTNEQLAGRIREKYKMKNTTGYSLNALVDFDDPVKIIEHLMIGSEGTLGFIAEINYFTVPELPFKATSLMLFPDTVTACNAVKILKQCKAEAVELMDRASLRSVEDKNGMPDYLKTLAKDACSLLVEIRAQNKEELQSKISDIQSALEALPKVMPVLFTDDKDEYKKLWDIRKGLFPSVGAMRKTGTTVIIEDIAFPIDKLAEATANLQQLFIKHGYYDAIIFGHALEGNLHFVFKQDFNSHAEVTRYKNFIDDISSMVVKKYNGAVKAEHGTGRNMAPFVEMEWGSEAYEIMKQIKNIFDPDGIINPGVILNNDSNAHIKNLKPLPKADPLVDKCIECGFCEVNCPSKNLTLSPRQRITVFREIARLNETGTNPQRQSELIKEFDYYGDQTCATDGLCATSCPVNINTGNLIKTLRADKISPSSFSIADILADNMKGVTSAMRFMLNLVDKFHGILGTNLMKTLSLAARKVTFNRLPLWNPYMPKGTGKINYQNSESSNPLKVVYFPSCINRSMGLSRDSSENIPLISKTRSLLEKAGYDILFPKDLEDLCCGMAFASKGYKKQGDRKAEELLDELIRISENGKYPVYFDMSPCLYRIKEYVAAHIQSNPAYSALKICEPVEFISEFLMDKLKFTPVNEKIAIHPTCSTIKLGLTDKIRKVAEACASEVIIPQTVGCCGWAGDRGFTYPELNISALENLKPSIPEDCHHGYSTSRTCEIGLSLNSGITYESIVYLVDKCTTK